MPETTQPGVASAPPGRAQDHSLGSGSSPFREILLGVSTHSMGGGHDLSSGMP
jgi:hypothetical protein